MDMSEQKALGATPITNTSRASKAYRAGRVCQHDGCGTVLSIYNRGKFCYPHEPIATPRTRGRKIA
jgi:hypothetical protein